MADITWKVSKIKYCRGHNNDTWVHVSPSTGTEETQLVVSVDQSSGGSSDCSAATITISASTGDIQYIPVTRCLRECSCKSIVINAVSVHEIANSGENNILLGSYDNSFSCSNFISATGVGIITNVSCSNGEIRGNVGKNCDDSRKSGTCEVYVNGEICKLLNTVWQKADVYTWTSASTRNSTTSVTAEAETSTNFGCSGGNYRAKGTKFFDIITKYECKDSCGQSHHEKDYEKKTGTGSTSLGSTGGTFSNRECDCETAYTKSMEVQFEADGIYSNVVTFTQTCSACPDDPKCSTECYYTIGGGGESEGCDDKNVSFTKEKHTS